MNLAITANGKPIAAQLPCSIEDFLVAQTLLSRSVVVANVALAVADRQS
jgi:hypothetical protein